MESFDNSAKGIEQLLALPENRKIRKPLMEKKRRARINESLETLKTILLECDPELASRAAPKGAKLEKADILELTVSYMKKIQRHHPYIAPSQGYYQAPAYVNYSPYSHPSASKIAYQSGAVVNQSQMPYMYSYPASEGLDYRLNTPPNANMYGTSYPLDTKLSTTSTHENFELDLDTPTTSGTPTSHQEYEQEDENNNSTKSSTEHSDIWRPW